MKKKYSAPSILVSEMELATVICVSGVGGSGTPGEPGQDIGYGGVDEGGVKNPASRQFNGWGEEEEDLY